MSLAPDTPTGASAVSATASANVSTAFELSRTPMGRLVCTLADGSRHESVQPVRSFPLAAPDEGIALVSTEGHELAWITRLSDLPAATRTLLEEEFASRELTPVILQLLSVSTFATPSTWTVLTDRGETRFILKGEEDIRRLGDAGALLITDTHGLHYRVPDRFALDKHSKKLIERFL
jgi:hypothetical protein